MIDVAAELVARWASGDGRCIRLWRSTDRRSEPVRRCRSHRERTKHYAPAPASSIPRWWSTQIVNVAAGQLLDVVTCHDSTKPAQWLAQRPAEWLGAIQWATLDLPGPYRNVFDTVPAHATQVAGPFHMHKLANTRVDECHKRLQNDSNTATGESEHSSTQANPTGTYSASSDPAETGRASKPN